MAASHETQLLAEAERVRNRKLIDRLRLSGQRRTIRAYRRLFLTEGGALSEDAALVITDLAALAKLGMVVPAETSEAQLRHINGAREVVLRLLARMDMGERELARISAQLRETET